MTALLPSVPAPSPLWRPLWPPGHRPAAGCQAGTTPWTPAFPLVHHVSRRWLGECGPPFPSARTAPPENTAELLGSG